MSNSTEATPVSPAPPTQPVLTVDAEFFNALIEAPTNEKRELVDKIMTHINSSLQNSGKSTWKNPNLIPQMGMMEVIPLIWENDTAMHLAGINANEMRRAKNAIKTAFDMLCNVIMSATADKQMQKFIFSASDQHGPSVSLSSEMYIVEGRIADYMVSNWDPNPNFFDTIDDDSDEGSDDGNEDGGEER